MKQWRLKDVILRAERGTEIPTLIGLLRERWLDKMVSETKGQMEKLRAFESHRERAQVC